MMKLGILTFPKAINYGAALQATALRKVLLQRGESVQFLDYSCKAIDRTSKVFDLANLFSVKYTIAHLYNMPEAIKRQKNFSNYWKKHLAFGSDNPKDYDAVIVGSDQVWNYQLTNDDLFYFLNFKKDAVKKVAYAASFGLSAVDEEHAKAIAPLLLDFDCVSVREKQAAKIVRETAGMDVPVVCDPTLLLNKSEWEEIAAEKSKNSGYIFVYTVFNSDAVWEYAKKLSQKTGLPIKTISYSKLHKREAVYDYTAGPDDWVGYMLGADYVVTNSFHGVAFSINFNKNFFFDMPPQKAGVGSRISDITERYSLQQRNISAADFADTTEAPDFEKANALLEEDRKLSFGFIDGFLTNEPLEESH